MLLKITKCEVKSNDWKVVDCENPTGEKTVNASVNRVNKKGEVFPAFDDIKVDTRLNAEIWVSPAGKAYLFAPKVTSGGGANRGNSGAITKAMETKKENIMEVMDAKGLAIKTTTTNQLATSMALAEYAKPNSLDTLETLFTKFQKFIWTNWEVDPGSIIPF